QTLTYTPNGVSTSANAAALSTTLATSTAYNLAATALTTPTLGWSSSAAALAGSSSADATAPQVRYDQNGNGIAVWTLGTDLFYRLYSKASDTWSAAATLDGALAGSPSTPHLSMSANGNALVTWEQNGDIYARRFVAGAWDGATAIPLLENLAGAARNPVGAINDAGRAVVSFIQVNGSVSNVYTNVYNGSAWQSAATAVEDIGTANANTMGAGVAPSVAIDPQGNATVLWLQRSGTQTVDSLYVSRFNAATAAWSTPSSTALENSTTAVAEAQIALDANGNGIALWLQGSTLSARSYTRSTDAWGAAVTLSTNASGTPNLSISGNGNALATWIQGGSVAARRYTGGAWQGTAATILENSSGWVFNPVGSINDAGQAAVVFVLSKGPNDDLYANRFSGGAWQTDPTLIEASSNAVASTVVPSVAIDAQGNVAALWLQANGTQTTDSVYANRFNAD